MSQFIHSATDATFDEALRESRPVLVDFWADWCGPCRALAPLLDEIAAEYAERIKVLKLDVDENPDTPARYGIRGIPTLMLFKDGEAVVTKVGALAKPQLRALIDAHL